MSIQISTIEQLQLIGNDAGYPLDGDYELANDIDASATSGWNGGAGFDPIGGDGAFPFTGTFDGKGYTITGLFVDRPLEDYVGLFGKIEHNAKISNVNIVSTVTGLSNAGGLIGSAGNGLPVGGELSEITNCVASGTVHCLNDFAGGLIGSAGYECSLSGCSSSCSVTCDSYYAGGLIGSYNGYNSTVADCYAAGPVVCIDRYAGGLIGSALNTLNSSITRCYATGTVDGGTNYTGGLIGYNEMPLSVCYASGNVKDGQYIGGLIGRNYGDISKCYSLGTVTTASNYSGGFVGRTEIGIIENAYAQGSVSGAGYTGGFAGRLTDATLANVYSVGAVSGTLNVGGLIGYISGVTVITSCYWNTDTTGTLISAGGTGKTTAEMKQQATFVGWDFDSPVWFIAEGETYPTFTPSALPTPITTTPIFPYLPDWKNNIRSKYKFSTAISTTRRIFEQRSSMFFKHRRGITANFLLQNDQAAHLWHFILANQASVFLFPVLSEPIVSNQLDNEQFNGFDLYPLDPLTHYHNVNRVDVTDSIPSVVLLYDITGTLRPEGAFITDIVTRAVPASPDGAKITTLGWTRAFTHGGTTAYLGIPVVLTEKRKRNITDSTCEIFVTVEEFPGYTVT